jgi:hypothetical protein
MKRILFSSVLVPFGLAFGAGCAVDDSVPSQTSQMANTGTGGDNSGSGGDNTTTTGTAGGMTTTTGAAGVMTVGAGGMTGGTGGMTGAGGTPGTGGGGSTGAGGDMGAGGMTGNLIDDVTGVKNNFDGTPGGTFTFKDSWFITGCAQQAGHDCITIQNCPNPNLPAAQFEDKGSVVNQVFAIGGAMGTTYAVTFKYNGVTEGKFMQGGMWAVPATDVATPGPNQPTVNENGTADDLFYIGGSAVPSNYNVMRIRVLDSTKKEVGRYYMNGYPGNSGAESHRTFLSSYQHTIDVPGKGFVEYHIEDSNCHAIDNCGPGNVIDGTCNAARNIPNEPAVLPTFPAMYTDVSKQATTPPGTPAAVLVPTGSLNPVTGAKQPWHSQLGHLTVTKVVAK